MKKVLSIILSLTILTCSVLSVSLVATANSIATADTVQVGLSYDYFYTEKDTYSHYYRFTPNVDGTYQFLLKFNVAKLSDDMGNSYINFYLQTGDLEDSGYFSPYYNACALIVDLKANTTYYFDAICFDRDTSTTFSVDFHNHTYERSEASWHASLYDSGSYANVCTTCGQGISIEIPKISGITLSKTSYVYDGKVKTPNVIVKDIAGNILVENKDFTVTHTTGRKSVGTYTVYVDFKGDYIGDDNRVIFIINPKSTSLKSVKAGKKTATVKWKKQSTQTSGYQIQYSTNKNFKKNNKTLTVKGNKKTSATIKKLKSNKKYYIRIRTYKTVDYKNYYSSWSKAKTFKVK